MQYQGDDNHSNMDISFVTFHLEAVELNLCRNEYIFMSVRLKLFSVAARGQ